MRLANFFMVLAMVVACTFAGAAQASVNAALDAVFVLRSADPEERFLGSGFLFGQDGVVLTNAHVVKGARRVILIRRDGSRVLADVVAVDRLRDIAVLRSERDFGPGLMAGDVAGVGGEVFAIGALMEASHTVTRGIISAAARQVEPNVPLRLLQHDAALGPGSSGGPLVDRHGRLLGMNSRIADGSRFYTGISYAISVHDLERLVPIMLAGQSLTPPALGLRVRAVSQRIAAALGLDQPVGVLVDNVEAGSPMDHAGLRAGDVILSFGGAELTGPSDLAFALERAGERITLVVWRDGQRQVLDVEVMLRDQASIRTMPPASLTRVRSYGLRSLGLRLDQGTRVIEVSINSPGHFAGLSEGDVIVTINGSTATNEMLTRLQITEPLLLLIRRVDGSTAHVLIDPWARHRPLRPAGGNVLDRDVVLF